ncbi:heparan sulfate D-glucosaminyl 3-O-sulfotransferase 1 precursor, partial [Reticulomyxa filosa]
RERESAKGTTKNKQSDVNFVNDSEGLSRLRNEMVHSKEIKFFDTFWIQYLFVLSNQNTTLMLEWYSKTFQGTNTDKKKFYFDASPNYFYQSQTPKLVKYFLTDASTPIRLLLLLRDPTDRFLSHLKLKKVFCKLRGEGNALSLNFTKPHLPTARLGPSKLNESHRQIYKGSNASTVDRHTLYRRLLSKHNDDSSSFVDTNQTHAPWKDLHEMYCHCLINMPTKDLVHMLVNNNTRPSLKDANILVEHLSNANSLGCIHNMLLWNSLDEMFTFGLYVKHLMPWLALFELNKDLLIVQSEEFFTNTVKVLREIEIFLHVSTTERLTEKQWEGIVPNDNGHTFRFDTQTNKGLDTAATSTLALLYRDHNQRLFQIIGKKFDWK